MTDHDDNGLIWAYRLDARGVGTQASGFDHNAGEPGFVWAHLRSDVTATSPWLTAQGMSYSVQNARSPVARIRS